MLSTLAMITFLAISCGSKGDSLFGAANVLKRVPADAAVVAVMNVGQMMNKLNYSEFKKTEMFQEMLKEAKSDDLKKILENPESSGIAMNGQFCMYADVKGNKDINVGFILPVKNVKELEAAFEKAAKSKDDSPFKKIETGKGYKYVTGKDASNEFAIGWDKNVLVFVMETKSDAKESLDKILNLKKDKSILTNKNFKSDKAEKHDVMLWVQSDPIVKMAKEDKKLSRNLKMVSLAGISEKALNGNSMALYYDFNKGDMQAGLSYNMSKELEDEYGIIFKKKMETDFSAYFPKKHLSVFTMIGLDIKGISQVLKNRGFDGLVSNYLSSADMTLKDLEKGLKGEIALAVYADPTAKNPRDAQKVVLAIAFDNSDFANKVLELPKKFGAGELKKSGNRYMSPMSKDVQGIIKNNVFVISNDISVIDQIENGGYKGAEAIDKDSYADMNKGWMSAHIDYAQLFTTLKTLPLGATGISNMGDMLNLLNKYNELQSATAVVSTEEAKVIVNLKNKNDNSLRVLSQLLNKMYLDRDEIQKEMDKIDMSGEDEEANENEDESL